MHTETHETLFAEIGEFVVEFEGLIQNIKDTIQAYFQNEEFYDTIPVEILTYDSTSSSLAKYFQAISLHYLTKKHSDKNNDDVELIKKFINQSSAKIIKAGEMRNDIIHASWFLSSIYGTDAQLEANRNKITKDGVVMRKLLIKPGILDNSIRMLHDLAFFVQTLGEIISAGALPIQFHLTQEDVDLFNKVDFENEREKLFVEDIDHYKRVLKDHEEMRLFFNEFDKKNTN